MAKPAHEELHHQDDTKQPELRIVQRGHDAEYEVWLNTGIDHDDGICFATGATRDEAVTAAVAVVEWLEATLQGPAPIVKSSTKL